MRLPVRLTANRFTSTFLHVVLPTSSLLVIASMFWIGFSGQREPLVQTDSEAGGATNLMYTAQLKDGANLTVRADTAAFLPNQVNATGVKGSIVYPDGYVRTFTSEKANAGWDMSYAGLEGGVFSETPGESSELTVRFETASAGSNGLIGRRVSATFATDEGPMLNLIADQLFVRADGASASASGGAVLTSSGSRAADRFTVRSEGFELLLEQPRLESAGEAEFEFHGGAGKAGLLRVTGRGIGAVETVEFLDGVEFTFADPAVDND